MALDAATLALVANELNSTLLDAKIDKIFEPTRDEVLMTLRTRTQTFKLLLSARSGSARVCLTKESFENPLTPPGFCMLLRKHLTGGRLTGLHMEPGDRIVFFDFLCTNEMGDLVTNTLAAELMGRYSNLVLIQSGKIIDALKRVDFEDSEIRQLLPDCRIHCRPNPISRIFWQPAPPPWWPLPAKKTCRWLLLWAKRLAVSAPLLRGRLCGVPLAAKRPCWPVTWTKRRSRPCAPQSKT